jgi:hypothetical protein
VREESLQVISSIVRKGAEKDLKESISSRRVVAVCKPGRMVTEGFAESAL